MYFSSPVSNITPAMTSVAMSRSDSRDSTSSNTSYNYAIYAPNSAYSALLSASPSSSWPMSHTLTRSDSDVSTGTNSQSFSQPSSVAMRRDSSNSSWLPSPYRSCMSSFGSEPSSYLSDDDLLCTPEALPPVETIPALSAPQKELTTEEQIAFLRELQEKEAARHHHHHHQHHHGHSHTHQQSEPKRKVVRFAGASVGPGQDDKPRCPSTPKRRQPTLRRGLSSVNGHQ